MQRCVRFRTEADPPVCGTSMTSGLQETDMLRTTVAALAVLAPLERSPPAARPQPAARRRPARARLQLHARSHRRPAVAATSTPAPPTVQLTGKLVRGSTPGPFNGTFTLNWTQTGATVDGAFQLSSPPRYAAHQRHPHRQHHRLRSGGRGHVHGNGERARACRAPTPTSRTGRRARGARRSREAGGLGGQDSGAGGRSGFRPSSWNPQSKSRASRRAG